MSIRDNWLSDEIELPNGKGKIEICIHKRNVVFVHGEVLGYKVADYQVDKPYGATKWGPGWMTRLDMGATPEERPGANVVKAIIPAVEAWAAKHSYRLDCAAKRSFAKT